MKPKPTQMNLTAHHPTHTRTHTLLNDVNSGEAHEKGQLLSHPFSLPPHHSSQWVGEDGRLMEQPLWAHGASQKTLGPSRTTAVTPGGKGGTKWHTAWSPPMTRRKDRACSSKPLFPKWAPITIITLITAHETRSFVSKWRFCTY